MNFTYYMKYMFKYKDLIIILSPLKKCTFISLTQAETRDELFCRAKLFH